MHNGYTVLQTTDDKPAIEGWCLPKDAAGEMDNPIPDTKEDPS